MAATLTPVYQTLQKTAAQAGTVCADDAKVRILAHETTRRQLLAGNPLHPSNINNPNKINNAGNTNSSSNTKSASNTQSHKRKKKTVEELRAKKTTGIVILTPFKE